MLSEAKHLVLHVLNGVKDSLVAVLPQNDTFLDSPHLHREAPSYCRVIAA
jgi:hypothetical protein